MLRAGDVFRSPRGTAIEVMESTPEVLRFRRTLPPGTGRALPHVHLDYDQTFEILEGAPAVKVAGERRILSAGDRVDVPRGTPHSDPWNGSLAPVVLTNTLRPQPLFIEYYGATYVTLLERGKLNRQDEFRPLQVFALVHVGRSESFIAGPPVALQRTLRPMLGAIGRLAGTRPVREAQPG